MGVEDGDVTKNSNFLLGADTNDFSPSARGSNESELLKSEDRKDESIPASKRKLLKQPVKSGKNSGILSGKKSKIIKKVEEEIIK